MWVYFSRLLRVRVNILYLFVLPKIKKWDNNAVKNVIFLSITT